MLGDVLLINDQHKSAAGAILERILCDLKAQGAKESGSKFVAAISGESGAGKSELSHSLALLLKNSGIRVKILHTDNYYRVHPLQRREHRISSNYESVGIEEYDWDLLHQHIEDFRCSRSVSIPCIDIITEEVDQLHTDFSKIQLLIIDGLYAIRTRNVDVRIFINLTYHDTKLSQMLRCKEPTDGYRWNVLEREHLACPFAEISGRPACRLQLQGVRPHSCRECAPAMAKAGGTRSQSRSLRVPMP